MQSNLQRQMKTCSTGRPQPIFALGNVRSLTSRLSAFEPQSNIDCGLRKKGMDTAKVIMNRLENIMEDAGLKDSLSQGNPLKNPLVLLVVVVVGKYLRAKYILKGQSKMNEFQPAWGHVITSKEQEKDLHAYTCKNCGTTIFIAKGREFRFFNKFAQCLNCGVVGQKNFVDTRDEIVAVADDENFVYESPVNYKLSKRQRKKLEQQEADAKAKVEKEEAAKKAATAMMEKEVEIEEEKSMADKKAATQVIMEKEEENQEEDSIEEGKEILPAEVNQDIKLALETGYTDTESESVKHSGKDDAITEIKTSETSETVEAVVLESESNEGLIAGDNNASLGVSHLSDTAIVTEKLDNEPKGSKRSPKPTVADDLDILGMD